MTIEQWLNQAKHDKEKLLSLLANYHPSNRQPGRRRGIDFITAPNAEIACAQVRKLIQDTQKDLPSPIDRFNEALDSGNWQVVNRLLNDAWFGVPESTSCWSIEGFREAVALMEDPPEIDDIDSHD